MLRTLILIATLAVSLTACSTPTLLRMRSLGEPIDLASSSRSDGVVHGINGMPRDSAGRIDAHVLYVHGIGWTQAKREDFGRDLVQAMSRHYGVAPPPAASLGLCTSPRGPSEPGSATIISDPRQGGRPFHTDDPRLRLVAFDLACVDRLIVDLGPRGKITVHRVFWDASMYDAFQYPHTGYDDALFEGEALSAAAEDIDSLRHKYNRVLKTALVTYGLTDAALYFGPIGELMRLGVAGALCVALHEAAGIPPAAVLEPGERRVISAAKACENAPPQTAPFMLIGHSLGSRILYDTLTDSGEGSAPIVKETMRAAVASLERARGGHAEVVFLANQLPVLAIGRVSDTRRTPTPGKPLRLVAISEIDDPLSYELVPYFEHQLMRRCYVASHNPECVNTSTAQLEASLRGPKSASVRQALLRDLGLQEVTDIRMAYAKPVFGPLGWLAGLRSPIQAHSGALEVPLIGQILACGAQDGVSTCREQRAAAGTAP